ncbi:hypothetical protein A7X76_10210 [Stenotrophomonas maltophilia]|uniref:hypothetical protein n=1 Tax=Stenotrophomonas maltophilia TaxID=40324 RepID=UPI000DA93DF7|nr:hypothetical protein [Stenotrophomonas maltophilia]PZS70577.1 hypothetical protein A7X76_10210 [Stenotrophomonas maltophilia]
MNTNNKTLADAQPGGRVRLGDQRSDLVPGIVRCAKCQFQLARSNLNMHDGTVTAGDSKTEPCPNGCGPLWPVTWETWAREGWAEAERLHLENAALSAQPSPGDQGEALPPLPAEVDSVVCMIRGEKDMAEPLDYYYTADQMRAYAQAALAARQPVGEAERRAPVQGYHGETIPWHVHGLAWEAYAKKYGNRQSAERLAERGGFGVEEMDMFLPGWRDMVEVSPAQVVDLQKYRSAIEIGMHHCAGFLGDKATRDKLRELLALIDGQDRPNG